MPVTYNSLRTVNGFRSPGFTVNSGGSIDTSGSITVGGVFTLSGELSSTANLTTTQTINGANLQLSSIAVEGNNIKTTITNQDLLLSVDGIGTIRLQEAVEVTGILSVTDTTEASSTTVASTVFSGGVGIAKALRVAYDSYVNGIRIGKGNNGIATNTSIGVTAMNAVTTGANNTALGYNSLNLADSGSKNTALGSTALDSLTTADDNTAVGYAALTANITGANNTAIGSSALTVSTGAKNIALGYNAGSGLTAGDANVIIGSATGSTITGTNNNILLSDGDGNIRLSFANTGIATFAAAIAVTGTVSANDATTNSHLVTYRQANNLSLAYMMFGIGGSLVQ